LNKKIIFLIFFILMAAGCSGPPREQPPEIYWPMPPEKPRIKFVDYIVGSIDVTGGRESKFSSLLFGEDADYAFIKPNFVGVRDQVVYVTDLRQVHVYNLGKSRFHTLGRGVLRGPTGIDVDSKGNVYVADSGARKIFIFSPDGKVSSRFSDPKLMGSMGGLSVDEDRGRFFVANTKRHNVLVFDLDGKYLFTMGGRGDRPGLFNYPYDVEVDKNGDIIVLDSGNFRVQVFDSEGELISIFGAVGTAPGHFARPKGVALSPDGYLFVVDSAFGNFQVFDKAGNVYLSVGRSGALLGEFLLPMGIAIGEDSKVYIVDQLNRRLQIFQYFPEK
jgi:DNA-binding beta-propeller fold protein YncE